MYKTQFGLCVLPHLLLLLKCLYVLRKCFYCNSNTEIFNMLKVGTNFKLFNKVLYGCLSFVTKICFVLSLWFLENDLRLIKIIWLLLGPVAADSDGVRLDSGAVRIQSLAKWHKMNLERPEPRVPSLYRIYPTFSRRVGFRQPLLCNWGSFGVEWFPRHWCPCFFSKMLLPCENS